MLDISNFVIYSTRRTLALRFPEYHRPSASPTFVATTTTGPPLYELRGNNWKTQGYDTGLLAGSDLTEGLYLWRNFSRNIQDQVRIKEKRRWKFENSIFTLLCSSWASLLSQTPLFLIVFVIHAIVDRQGSKKIFREIDYYKSNKVLDGRAGRDRHLRSILTSSVPPRY